MSWKYTGVVRIHFNKKDEAPLFASLTNTDHSWEVLAKQVIVSGNVVLRSYSNMDARPGLDPIWWLEGYVTVFLGDDGVATITAPEE